MDDGRGIAVGVYDGAARTGGGFVVPGPRASGRQSSADARGGYAALKRLLDVSGALVLTVALSPVIAVVICALKLDGGQVLFQHRRIGRHGKRFSVYKFRSMVPDAQQVLDELLEQRPELREQWERDHKLKDDPRITWIGHFLRKTSLDELPQLFNVMRGDMSLVGPRPIVDAEIPKYGRAARHYFASKPGVTGLWQVSGRNDTDYRRRVAMDRYYAERASLWLDLGILLRTVLVVLRGRGAY